MTDIIRDDRYDVNAFLIMPFVVLQRGNNNVLHPCGEGYGFRIGVYDKANNYVIDVDMKCGYDYIEVKSYGLVNNPLINPGFRYAYMPVYVSVTELSSNDIDNINNVINDLRQGKQFPDGNCLYTNEQYLEQLDELTLQKELAKIKD